MQKQEKYDPRKLGAITIPPHLPLTFPDLYYYINYETPSHLYGSRIRLTPEMKWESVTIAFIRYGNDCPNCFGMRGNDGVEGGVGDCGRCRVVEWCEELVTHLERNYASRDMFMLGEEQ